MSSMVTFNLLAYIRRERDKGILIDKITETLLFAGWEMIDVVNAYGQLKIDIPNNININNVELQKEQEAEALVPLSPYTFSSSDKKKK